MVRWLALLSVSCVGCRDAATSCLEERWSIVIDDARSSQPCAVEIAPDGTAVILTTGESASLVEVSSDGTAWRVITLPPTTADVDTARCTDLAIADDGTRWAVVSQFRYKGTSDSVLYRVTPSGEPGVQPTYGTGRLRWLPMLVAVQADALYLAGIERIPDDRDPHAGDPFVARLVLETGALEVLDEPSGLRTPIDLVAPGPERVYAVARPPSIDYSDAHLLAIDPGSAEQRWSAIVGAVGDPQAPEFSGVFGIDDADVLVAAYGATTTTSIERFDPDGRSRWRWQADFGAALGGAEIAKTREHVTTFVHPTAARPDLELPPPRGYVIDFAGEEFCSAATPIPRAMSPHPGFVVGGDSRSDGIVAAGRREDAAGIWVSALAIE